MDVDSDDKQLCDASLNGNRMNLSQFCDYYRAYHATNPTPTEDAKKAARNEMIDLVGGQVDIYYKQRKDERRNQVRWLQMLFDILEVGSSTAIAIMNGERDKTVVGAALSGFQSGRTDFNRNFDILQTQILINKMNANRAEIMTEIANSKGKTTGDYSWYAAKDDLRRYLFAGTFSNALETLVEETGADAERAEDTLKAATGKDISASRQANTAIMNLREALRAPATQDTAARILRDIVAQLRQDEEIATRIAAEGITDSTDAETIRLKLVKIRGDFVVERRNDLVIKMNDVIRSKGALLEP